MRLRNVKGSQEKISQTPFAIQADEEDCSNYKGLWNKNIFQNDNPIWLEIGMGKGRFLMDMAAANPNINFIGIEKYSSVLIRAIEKRETLELDNVFFLRMDAEDIVNFFAPQEVSRLYLNFSDPWPKDRHAKRRLTSKQFLKRYEQILTENGELQFKTDNRPLFDFSLEEIKESGWTVLDYTFDLHGNGIAKDNVMTEYEEKFHAKGMPICRLTAKYIT